MPLRGGHTTRRLTVRLAAFVLASAVAGCAISPSPSPVPSSEWLSQPSSPTVSSSVGPTASPTGSLTGSPGGAPSPPAPLVYTVRPGDTLASIAARFVTSWQSLVYWNQSQIPGLNPSNPAYDPNAISVGWQLTVEPDTAVAWSPPARHVVGLVLRGTVINVPILYLHKVRPIPSDIGTWPLAQQNAYLAYMLTPCEFGADLDWLAAHGYHTILPRDLAAHWDHGPALPSKPILLTFDDGSPDWTATVLPMLQAHQMLAEFYTDIGFIGTDLSWSDLAQLRDAGMGIGAHDMTHVQLVVGGRELYSITTMLWQITEAKTVLESHLGIRVDSMAYVGGGYDATLMQLARQAGYLTARAIVRGTLQSPSLRFQLRVSRPAIYDDVVGKTLANAMSCTLDPSLTDFEARVSGTNPG
jgi:peptidoglycan/xylan/chitin deacetylase (PgdA/CDA1 family)